MRTKIHSYRRVVVSVLIFAILFCFAFPSVSAFAKDTDTHKKVRVGWYYSDYFQEGTSDQEQKSGYAYEYLQNVSNFTGWEYEYVYGSWAELYDLFLKGEIDLMAGMSYTEDRALQMLFPKYEMGYESYYLYQKFGENSISAENVSTLRDKKVGVISNNLLTTCFETWMQENGATCEEVMFDSFELRDKAFYSGEIDAIIGANNNIHSESGCSPVVEVGQSSYYLAVAKGREDLLNELNGAIAAILKSNPYYTDSLHLKYFQNTAVDAALSAEEKEWLETHDAIKVGYIEDYLPFCATDENQQLTGVITNVFDTWKSILGLQEQMEIVYVQYPTYTDVLEGLRNNEIDVAFPVVDSIWLSEQNEIVQTNNLLESSVSIIYKGDYSDEITDCIAITDHSAFQDAFTTLNYPDSEIYVADSAKGCMDAVKSGKATCTIFNSGRAEMFLSDSQYESLHSLTITENIRYCMGVKKGNTTLYSLLERGICLMDKSDLTTKMYQYINSSDRYSSKEFIRDHIVLVIGILMALIVAITMSLFLYIRSTGNELKALEKEKLQFDIFSCLSKDYGNVYLIDGSRGIGRVLKLNGYITQGLSQDDTLEQSYDLLCETFINDRVYEDDRPMMLEAMKMENVLSHLKNDGEYVGTYRVMEEGEIHYYHFKYILTENNNQIILGFQNIDLLVKEREIQKKQLKEALDSAEQANNAKTAFLFNMSHDIRTPMNAIIGFTELLEKNLDNPQKRVDYIRKIKISNQYLLSLINNVLEMARIESGSVKLTETVWDVQQFSDALYSVFEQEAQKKNITFERTMDVQHTLLFCDTTKLREIFLNIISNAIKYTPAGGRINLDLKELPSDREGYIRYKTVISDTGIGMSKEFLPTLFDEFTREKTSTESKIEGTGLGMSITKKLVDLFGGTIEVESEIGKGTAFTVILPHRIATEDDLKNANLISKEYRMDVFIGKRLLLAEDNDLNREIAVEILTEAGFEVDVAQDGEIAVNMIKDSEPGWYDLVLMDIQMPNLNGYDATRQIRAMSDVSKACIPIIAMTANAFEEDKENALQAGMDGHIAKPVEIPKLMETLTQILDGNQSVRQSF